MNQIATGKYIAQKRKEKNITQAQLAEILGISNKTVSKWENGKCMPDYSIIEMLCDELGITVTELIDGRDIPEENSRPCDNAQILDLLRRTQELEKQKNIIYAVLLIVMGIAMQALSYSVGGSNVMDFVSGFLLGLSIAVMLVGIYLVGKNMKGK